MMANSLHWFHLEDETLLSQCLNLFSSNMIVNSSLKLGIKLNFPLT